MPKLERLLVVSIPEEDIKKEFGWLYQRWGEDAVKTHLIKNSRLIDEDLILVGVGELPHNAPPSKQKLKRCCDMIFRKRDVYYVVEVKTGRDGELQELLQEVVSFEHDMGQHNENCKEVVPVLAIVDDSIHEPKPFWHEKDDTAKWMKSYINELLKGK